MLAGMELEVAEQLSVNYGLWSLLPASLAIGMALMTRQVYVSLFIGIWSGAWLLSGGDFSALAEGFLRTADTWILHAIVPTDASTDHATIMLFTLITGCMIGIISHNGGISGVVANLVKWVKTPKQGQLASMGVGLSMFFDDYASMLVTGNIMRPLADKCRISREKLAYIVDTTAAPIASTAVITTWIGFQVSLIDEALTPLSGLEASAYELMLDSLPYSFYSILSILFIFMLIATRRDFGPMLAAEQKARLQPIITATPATPSTTPRAPNAWNALLPLAVLVISIITGLVVTGWPAEEGGELSARQILGNADPFKAMLWGSLASLTSAIAITKITTSSSLTAIMNWMESGMMPMLQAVIVLTLAWAIAGVNQELGTAEYLVAQLQGNLSPQLLPAIIFMLASAIAFATGTSWGVMAILIPLAIPLVWGALQASGMTGPEYMPILYATIASTLTGAVLGDHCSPISDTTILSSLSSGCDHIEHVRTQLPYAMLIGGVSILCALIPVGYGMPWWAGMAICLAVLALLLRVLGKTVADDAPKAA